MEPLLKCRVMNVVIRESRATVMTSHFPVCSLAFINGSKRKWSIKRALKCPDNETLYEHQGQTYRCTGLRGRTILKHLMPYGGRFQKKMINVFYGSLLKMRSVPTFSPIKSDESDQLSRGDAPCGWVRGQRLGHRPRKASHSFLHV